MITGSSQPKCRYCGAVANRAFRKCSSCGEWFRAPLKQVLETTGRVLILASFLLGLWELRESRKLQEVSAINTVLGRFTEIDRFLIDRPELAGLIVPAEDYDDVARRVQTPEGLEHVREEEFVAYMLDIFENEFVLREEYGVYPPGGEFVAAKAVSNPRVIDFWYKEGLRDWYSEPFREWVERNMPKK